MTNDPVALRSALDALREKWLARAEQLDDGCYVTECAIAAEAYRDRAAEVLALLTALPLPQLQQGEEDKTLARVDIQCLLEGRELPQRPNGDK